MVDTENTEEGWKILAVLFLLPPALCLLTIFVTILVETILKKPA